VRGLTLELCGHGRFGKLFSELFSLCVMLLLRDETEKERENYNRTRKIRISSILFFFKLFSELFSLCVMLVKCHVSVDN
jgi:uncharacterized membrane protein YeiB